MCALAHVLERNGIATLVIGLVPQHVAAMQPPRALNVPFELGRPLGEPNDPDFQRQVLDALFVLLEASGPGPIVDDFPHDSPSQASIEDGWACPVSFPVGDDSGADAELRAEISALMPWFERAIRNQPSGTGTSGLAIDAVVDLLLRARDGGLADDSAPDGIPLGDWIKLAVEDFKLFYAEAMGAQPRPPGAAEFSRWFWGEAKGGELVRSVKAALSDHPDKALRTHARFTFVPSELH